MKRHESMRGWFAYELYQQMKKNKDIYLIVADLGYKVFDQHFKDFPERCINTGAAEMAAHNICVGLALENKIPFFYSITPFLLYRPFEAIRLYTDHENIPVKLIGSGRDRDYAHDGFSHHAEEAEQVLECLPNIKTYWPHSKEQMNGLMHELVTNDAPSFVSLRR